MFDILEGTYTNLNNIGFMGKVICRRNIAWEIWRSILHNLGALGELDAHRCGKVMHVLFGYSFLIGPLYLAVFVIR